MKHYFTLRSGVGCALILLLGFSGIKASAQTYCIPVYSNDVCGSDDYLESFSTTGGTTNITNSNSGCSPNTGTAINNYSDNSATMIHTAVQGTVVNYSFTNNNHWEEGYRIWVDWNGDGDCRFNHRR